MWHFMDRNIIDKFKDYICTCSSAVMAHFDRVSELITLKWYRELKLTQTN